MEHTHVPRAFRQGTPIPEPKWKWPFIWSFIALCVIVPVIYLSIQHSRDTKAAAYAQLANDIRSYFCVVRPSGVSDAVADLRANGILLNKDWQNHVASVAEDQSLQYSSVASLTFGTNLEGYLMSQCAPATVLQGASLVITEYDEKVSAYDELISFRSQAMGAVFTEQQRIADSARRAFDLYAEAERAAASVGQPIAQGDMKTAQECLMKGDWETAYLSAASAKAYFELLSDHTPVP